MHCFSDEFLAFWCERDDVGITALNLFDESQVCHVASKCDDGCLVVADVEK